eukprot:c7500_g1_i1 orf=467-1096(-)
MAKTLSRPPLSLLASLAMRSFSVAALVAILLLATARISHSSSEKCAACRAVAAELEIELLNERPRNHLDMRHRLDSRGQREGKVIDYRVSELRVVELLDGLCSKMKGYTLGKTVPGKVMWVRVDDMNESLSGSDRQEAEAYSKQMTTYCGRLLEETDEELGERIRSGLVKAGQVERTLCWELSHHCTSAFDEEDNSQIQEETSESDAEL